MDSLRLILLVIGLVFIAILYLVLRVRSGQGFKWPGLPGLPYLRFPSFRRSKKENENADIPVDPRDAYYSELDEDDLQALSQMSMHASRDQNVDVAGLGGVSAVDAEEDEGESLVIVLNVMARPGDYFSGDEIFDALQANKLQHGEMMIFHRYPDEGGSRPIFSLANTVEPGTFNLDTISHLQTPGLSLFMQLPGPLDSRDAFELMLKTGRQLAEQLGGDLCDERRNVLTLQTIGHLKEQVEAFLLRRKMAGLQKNRSRK